MTVMDVNKLFKQLYNIFDPIRPLEVGNPAYVDCQAVRGNTNSIEELSKEIVWANEGNSTCQLYTGHRGNGKSTELKRLVNYLEQQGYLVVYFDVLEDGIDPEDARYTDILIACTRCLLSALQAGDDHPIRNWLTKRLDVIKELSKTAITVTEESTLGLFSQLTTQIKAVPTLRHQIRQALDPHTPSLLQVLNDFINDACVKLGNKPLVLIADSLDRIVPIETEHGRINHDEIFVDRSEQLKGLACHVIYTVPISMLYSGTANHLNDRYGPVKVLPMVKVRERGHARSPYLPGIRTFKALIEKRIQEVSPHLTLEELFANEDIVTTLCLTSGGNTRELMHLMRNTLRYAPLKLPVAAESVQRAIAELRESYRRMIFADHWKMLAEVYLEQSMPNRDEYRKLLYDRCVLEYRQLEANQEITTWHDVHPLIVETEEFKTAYKSLSSHRW